jgi:uncharacterized protein
MVIGTLEIHLRLQEVHSLKEKRRIVRPLVERIRNDFHAAAAEVGDHDLWGNAVLGVAVVSNDAGHVESILHKLMDAVDALHDLEVQGVTRDIFRTS